MRGAMDMPKRITSTICLIMTFCMISGHVLAKDEPESKNPLGCRDVGYKFDLKTVQFLPGTASPAIQSMYFVFNKLNESVNLYQMRDEKGVRNLYMNHTVDGNAWSVLSTNEKDLKYICTVNDKRYRYGRVIDCEAGIKVCQYTNVKYGLNNRGNYWLIGSATKSEALSAVIRYGIIPAV